MESVHGLVELLIWGFNVYDGLVFAEDGVKGAEQNS